jgi:pimeloyl-ACP methyl ester carboxylesterase
VAAAEIQVGLPLFRGQEGQVEPYAPRLPSARSRAYCPRSLEPRPSPRYTGRDARSTRVSLPPAPGARARLGEEIEAGLTALRARFGPRVAEGPLVYAGFSRGAFVGVPLLLSRPERFPRAVLGEGGQSAWTDDAAKRYAAGGGKRVLFVCTTLTCEEATRPAMARLERAGVKARMASAGNIGHWFDGRVVEAIKPAWPWLVEGDPRFALP